MPKKASTDVAAGLASNIKAMDPDIHVHKATATDIPVLIGLMKEFYAEAGFELDDEKLGITSAFD